MLPTTSESWIGQEVGQHKRYRLEKLLGRGGMGTVFLAKEIQLGKTVAVKILKESIANNVDCLKRFEREASICVALADHSQHIARIEDYGVTESGFSFFVMEYLQGETLKQRLDREKQLPLATSLHIFKQICLGLKVAHEGVRLWRQGQQTEPIKIVHRDLKPENIFLVPSEVSESGELVKILDFGIAKVYGDEQATRLTQTGFFIGSFSYASPEQCRTTADVDRRSDIYSLGVILYRMLAGVDPYGLTRNSTSVEFSAWLFAHTTGKPEPLCSQPGCADLDPRLEALVHRCLAKDPQERPQSTDEMLAVLKTLAAEPGQVRPAMGTQVHQTTADQDDAAQTLPSGLPVAPAVSLVDKPSPRPKSGRRLPPSQLLLAGVGGLALLGGGFFGLQVHSSSARAEIQRLKDLSQFERCINRAENFPAFLPTYAQVQVLLNACRLELGKQWALEGRFAQAIAAVRPIPSGDPSYADARSFSEEWAKGVLPNVSPTGTIDICATPNSPFCSPKQK